MNKTKTKRRSLTMAEIQAKAIADRAARFEAAGLQIEASKLRANAAVEVTRPGEKTRDKQTARNTQIARLDAFHQLHDSLCDGGYDAVRKFEAQLTIRAGEHDRGRGLDRVDCSTSTDRTDAMIKAAGHVENVILHMSKRGAWLLSELLDPSVQTRLSATTWRDVVAYVTGETNPVAQATRVKTAVEDLVEAYIAIEGPRQTTRSSAATIWRPQQLDD